MRVQRDTVLTFQHTQQLARCLDLTLAGFIGTDAGACHDIQNAVKPHS